MAVVLSKFPLRGIGFFNSRHVIAVMVTHLKDNITTKCKSPEAYVRWV